MGFTQIGKITKHKGLKGYCILKLNLDIEFDFKNINSLYLELRGSKVPFSIEKLSIINTTTIELKFKDYNSREDNNMLINTNVFIENKSGIKFESELSKIIGYEIKENNKVIGTITNNKETMIPYTKEIIHRVDNFKKEIHVIIPKGLLDLN